MKEEQQPQERSMDFFMKGRGKELPVEEVPVTARFLDDKGKPIPFLMRALSTDRIEELEEECTVPITKKGRKVGEELDAKRFAARVAIETTVYPNFRSPELRKSYGTEDAVEVAKAVLSVGGEYIEWIRQAQRVNKFDEDFEDLLDDAKN